jgi:hypothetical protein
LQGIGDALHKVFVLDGGHGEVLAGGIALF